MLKISPRFVMLAGLLAAAPASYAQSETFADWTKRAVQNPSGWVYQDSGATLARYTLSALDAANAGGLSEIALSDPEARIEHALSIIEMGMSEFEMTTLSGMPAAVGTVYMEDGEVAFAASLSGRAGSDREILSVWYAPQEAFERLGGLAFLKANPPSATVNYSAESPQKPKPKPKSTRPVQAPPAEPKTGPKSSGRPMTAGEKLLAGVRGDLKKIEDKTLAEQAKRRAENAAARAANEKAERQRIYAASGARKGRYPAPTPKEEFREWPIQGEWGVQVPNDSASPRVATRSFNANMGTSAALRAFAKETGLKIRGSMTLEPLESYKSLDGRDVRILFTETRLNNAPGVAFVFYARGKGNTKASLRVMEMPKRVFQKWGGAAGMLYMRRIVPSPDVFPAKERQRIARAPLDRQTQFYESVLDKFYRENVMAMMMTQAQTTAMMMELNYDLLFGNDITPGPWGD